MLAWALLELGEQERAEGTLARVIAQLQVCGWRLLEVDALRVLALLELRRGRWHEARAALEKGMDLSNGIPDGYPYAKAKGLYMFGLLHARTEEYDNARATFQAALGICDQLGERMYRPCVERALAALGA